MKFLQRDVLFRFVGERGQQGGGHSRQQHDCGGAGGYPLEPVGPQGEAGPHRLVSAGPAAEQGHSQKIAAQDQRQQDPQQDQKDLD